MALSEETVEAGGRVEKSQEVRECEWKRGSKGIRGRRGELRVGVSRGGNIRGNGGAGVGGRS